MHFHAISPLYFPAIFSSSRCRLHAIVFNRRKIAFPFAAPKNVLVKICRYENIAQNFQQIGNLTNNNDRYLNDVYEDIFLHLMTKKN